MQTVLASRAYRRVRAFVPRLAIVTVAFCAMAVPLSGASAAPAPVSNSCGPIVAGEAVGDVVVGATAGQLLGGIHPYANYPNMHIKGYSLAADVGANGLPRALAKIIVAADPHAPPGWGAFFALIWKGSGASYWAGATIDDPTAATVTTAVSKSTKYFVGTGDDSLTSPFTRDTAVSAEGTQVRNADGTFTMTIAFPYGPEAGPGIRPAFTAAKSFEVSTGYLQSVPVPVVPEAYPLVSTVTVHGISAAPAAEGTGTSTGESGPGGNPFCSSTVDHRMCEGIPSSYDAAPPSGIVSCTPTRLPNWFAEHYAIQPASTQLVRVIPDPARHVLLEWIGESDGAAVNGAQCAAGTPYPYNVVAYDSDSYAFLGGGCVHGTVGGTMPRQALDSADGLLFLVVNNSGIDSLAAVSYSSPALGLTDVGRISLPPGSLPTIYGLSWSEARHEMLALTASGTAGSTGTPPGLDLAALRLESVNPVTASSPWNTVLSGTAGQGGGCQYPLGGQFTTANAYFSDLTNSIYVPCVLDNASTQGHRDGIVRLELDTAGKPAAFFPTEAPGLQNASTDYLFDPGSDRAFLIWGQPAGYGVNVYVPPASSDGGAGTFLGRSGVGTRGDAIAFGLDGLTGRMYAVGSTSGLSMIDVRRTPVGAPTQSAQFAGMMTPHMPLPILPPTATRPFSRLIVNYGEGTTDIRECAGHCRVNDFVILADREPVTRDPDPAGIDANTYVGPLSSGDQIATTFSGGASGYGMHVVYVGSADRSVANIIGTFNANPFEGILPFGGGTRDMMGGALRSLAVTDGSGSADATALAAVDNATADTYATCTDLQNVHKCVAPPTCVDDYMNRVGGSNPGTGVCRPQLTNPLSTKTAQQWPFPESVCSNPSSDGRTANNQSGVAVTKGYSPTGDPEFATLPGSDSAARSSADCAYKGSNLPPGVSGIYGRGQLQALDLDSQATAPHSAGAGIPYVSVTQMVSLGTIVPAHDGQPIAGSVASRASGIYIDLGTLPGDRVASSLSIGSVTQIAYAQANGLPGTALTKDDVQISQVSITRPDPSDPSKQATQRLCQQICTSNDDLIKNLNAAFPSTLSFSYPSADAPFGTKDGAPLGSPMGYLAAVRASKVEALSDNQFNGMQPETAAIKPGMRITVLNDGQYGLNREVIDLAGAAVNSQLGRQLIPAGSAGTSGSPDSAILVDGIAGVPGIPGRPGAGESYLLITDSNPVSAFVRGIGSVLASGPGVRVVEEFFSRFGLTSRRLAEMLTMFALLALLGLPLFLMARRQLWSADRATEG
jgi:hypothetical protein